MATPSTSSPAKYCPVLPECVHKQFETQARRTPDAIAVESGDAAWSYAALDAYANRLAHKLVSAGVTRGTMVGLCVPRSYEAIAALLGILKAGAAYVPFDL